MEKNQDDCMDSLDYFKKFLEQHKDQIFIPKSKIGIQLYTLNKEDVENLRVAYNLVKVTGAQKYTPGNNNYQIAIRSFNEIANKITIDLIGGD